MSGANAARSDACNQSYGERPPENRLLFRRVVASKRLSNKASRSGANEIEAGEDDIEYNGASGKAAKQRGVTELANDGGIHQSEQWRRQIGERHRNGDGQDRAMRHGKWRYGVRHRRSVLIGEACHGRLPIPRHKALSTEAEKPEDYESRNDDGSAEKEIAQEALDGRKTHVPDVDEEVADALKDIERRPSECAHDDADEKGNDEELQENPKRRVAEKARHCRQNRFSNQ